MDGQTFLPLLAGEEENRDREFLCEYFREPAFPHIPTTFALRGNQYKYIWYHGVWERDELYDLQNDPRERYNLAEVLFLPGLKNDMRQRLFDLLEEKDAMQIPLRRAGWQADEKLIGN
jgi:N-acetylglucosamine-6-sulfatase